MIPAPHPALSIGTSRLAAWGERGVTGLRLVCDVAAVLTMLALVVVTGTGVVSRYMEGSPFAWTDEVASYLFVALTFTAAAAGAAREGHPRIELLITRLPPPVARLLSAAATGAALLLLGVLLVYGIASVQQAVDVSMVSLDLSQGWAYIVLPAMAGAMIVFVIANFLRRGPRPAEFVFALLAVAALWGIASIPVSGGHLYGMLVGLLFGLLLAGVPVGFALALTSLLVLNAAGIPLSVVPQQLFDGTSSIILLAIPLFMLTGTIMAASGMAARLSAFATAIFGGVRGGLGIADVGASVIFADISGSAVADTAAIGAIMIPQLRKRGYSLEFASALQAAAGSLGLMFPPSSTMLIYAWITNISVSRLFLSSFLPGLLVAVSFALIIHITARRRNYPRETDVGPRAILRTGRQAFFALLTPVLILSAILGGVTTPSEAGVIAAVYSITIALLCYRSVKLTDLYAIWLEAALSASRVTLIIAAATLLSWVMTSFQGPQQISAMLRGVTDNPIIMLILLNILMTVLHIMLEGISTILVLVPVILPLLHDLHIDLVVFGIILAQNSALGLLFPPLGFNLYVISSISGVSVERVAIAVLPFVGILAADIVLLIFFPQIVTLLPTLLH